MSAAIATELQASLTTRLSALSLAALVTGGVLMGLGNTADRHYDEVLLAQSRSCTPYLAGQASIKTVG